MLKRIALLALAAALPAHGQAFINLDFEAASIVPVDPDRDMPELYVKWGPAAPGWRFEGSSDDHEIFHGTSHVGLVGFHVLVDREAEYLFNRPLEGRFSLAFKGGNSDWSDWDSPWVYSYIAQDGTVPESSRSVRLLGTGSFGLYFDDQALELVALGGDAWGADISAFAGRTGELKIVNLSTEHGVTTVDGIAFSTAPIPEPSHAVLMALGVGALLARRRRPA